MCDPSAKMPEIVEVDNWKHRSAKMKCRTCMYWVRKVRLSPSVVGAMDAGRCRRHSPTMSGWPVVMENDWCGDHKLNEEAI